MRLLFISLFILLSQFEAQSQCTTVFTAPYSEEFNGASWLPAWYDPWIFVFSPGTIDPCWNRDPSNYKKFFVIGPVNGTLLSKTGTTEFVHSYFGQNPTIQNNTSQITSPKIDISNLTNPQIEIWHHIYGSNAIGLGIQVNSFGSTSWQTIDTILPAATGVNAVWRRATVDIDTSLLSSDTISVRFLGYSTSLANSSISFDDFSVQEKSLCPAPDSIWLVSVSDSDAVINWSGSGSAWQIEITPGFTYPGNGTIINANAKPFHLSGLSDSTQYTIYVRDTCAISVPSLWSEPFQLTTTCPIITAPYFENFDANGFVPNPNQVRPEASFNNCYQRVGAGSIGGGPNNIFVWSVFDTIPTSNSGPNHDHTGNGNFLSYAWGIDAEVQTPQIDISLLQNPKVYFWYHMYGADIEKLKISAVINNVEIPLDSILGQQHTSKSDPWSQKSIDLSNLPSTDVQIRFTAKSTGWVNCDIAIDDLLIDEGCAGPDSIFFNSISNQSAVANWLDSNSTHWSIEYGLQGFTLGQGTIDSNITNPSYTLNGLTPGTTYSFYVESFCSIALGSTVYGPYHFTTSCDSVAALYSDSTNLLTVYLDATPSFGTGLNYNWIFGDGSIGSGSQINHSYSAPGNYTLKLLVLDTCGSVDSTFKMLQVCEELIAGFTYSELDSTFTFVADTNSGASQFVWNFGDGNSGTGATIQHTYNLHATPPPYSVTLTALNDCNAIDSTLQTVNSTFSVAEKLMQKIVIFPNPTSAQVVVKLPVDLQGNIEIQVYDALGKSLNLPIDQSANQLSFDLSNYTNGLYSVKISSGNHEIVKRISLVK